MKKYIFLLMIISGVYNSNAQGFGVSISAGYLSEIEAMGFGADLIYEFDEKWGVSTNGTWAVADIAEDKLRWLAFDLNARYKVYDNLYALIGGELLRSTFTDRSNVGGFIIGETKISMTDYGVNLGTGYKYNIADNVNIFAEVKYVVIETGYVHARAGVQFDL